MNQYLAPVTELVSIDMPAALAASGNTEDMGSKDGIWDAVDPRGAGSFNF